MDEHNKRSLGKKLKAVEKQFAKGLIKWRLKKTGSPLPDEDRLDEGSEQVVDLAHEIIKQRSSPLLDELKAAKKEFMKAYKDEHEEK